ncbi:galactose oxidase-like domain-containing protein [Streptomyces sp. MS06]|uniref:galactose oxidase-like domain-containing protein n=1 Tax=Streptomyces sp. MS06 TaxID=3385974 RepID=UPI00399EF3DD
MGRTWSKGPNLTGFDRRSVAPNAVRHGDGSLTVRVPDVPSPVPSGWNMVFATDHRGTPCGAQWIHVGAAG